VNEVCAKPNDERRARARERRLFGAKIVFNNNSSVIDCVLRDLCPQGARLLVPSTNGIPDQFDLRINRNGVCHPSKVAWRVNGQLGVTFLDHQG
jgi:PilZ domain-containing protein